MVNEHTTTQHHYTLSDILGNPCSQEEAAALLKADEYTQQSFDSFPKKYQEKLLSFLRGKRGLSITYDSFFKKIMNPDVHPERLESFLSALLNQNVQIHAVLPVEGNKLADAGSLVIMDLLVQLEDGTTIDVEIQKIGYIFPGERSSCYISDLIMRQYNRVKSARGDKFSFRDLKPVIMIVIMEGSAKEFKAVAPHYIHREMTTYDSGAKVHSMSKIIYVSLDTFHSVVHNINNQLEAWLTFLSSDNPDRIVQLVNTYPEFLSCYRDIVEFRKNPRGLIHMFSEALTIMDRNTAKLMVEQMEDEIKEKAEIIRQMDVTMEEQKNALAEKATLLAKKDASLAEKDASLAEKDAQLAALQAELALLKSRN